MVGLPLMGLGCGNAIVQQPEVPDAMVAASDERHDALGLEAVLELPVNGALGQLVVVGPPVFMVIEAVEYAADEDAGFECQAIVHAGRHTPTFAVQVVVAQSETIEFLALPARFDIVGSAVGGNERTRNDNAQLVVHDAPAVQAVEIAKTAAAQAILSAAEGE